MISAGPAGTGVLVHLLSLALVCLCVERLGCRALRNRPHERLFRSVVAILILAIAAISLAYDRVVVVQREPDHEFFTTYKLLGDREVYSQYYAFGFQGKIVYSIEGPMAGDPAEKHGKWTYLDLIQLEKAIADADARAGALVGEGKGKAKDVTTYKTCEFYWYGEEVTQGEFERRRRP